MTEADARRAVDILAPHFPVAEARRGQTASGYRFWFVRTYGSPDVLDTPENVGQFIADKIRGETDFTADIDDREALDAQDQKQAEKENAIIEDGE